MASVDDQPLTRREARARAGSAAPVADLTRPAASASRRKPAKARGSVRNRRALAKAVRTHGRKRPVAVRIGSKLLSLGALMFAGALLVGMSVPANAFMPVVADVAVGVEAPKIDGQTMEVSAEAKDAVLERDGFEAISYAEALALKYAAIDYSYEVTSGDVRWPFPVAVPITDGFGPRDGGFHKGVDFVPGEGTPIYAIADGVATTATFDNSGYGQHVVLQHNLGGVDVESLYGHMIADSSPIQVGDEVKVGDFLGLVGDTGIAYGAHLHFEIHIDKVPVDPFDWLQANAVN